MSRRVPIRVQRKALRVRRLLLRLLGIGGRGRWLPWKDLRGNEECTCWLEHVRDATMGARPFPRGSRAKLAPHYVGQRGEPSGQGDSCGEVVAVWAEIHHDAGVSGQWRRLGFIGADS